MKMKFNQMNADLKKMLENVRSAQAKLQDFVKNQDWVDEARKYAERQGAEVKKVLSSDVNKVKSFLEKEKKELERLQKQIPGEVKKLRGLVKNQTKDFEKFLNTLRKNGAVGGKKAKSKKASTGPRKKAASSKKTPAAST